MLKKRIIPKIIFVPKRLGNEEKLVAITTKSFTEKRVIGDPISQARVFENTGADQLLLINKQRLTVHDSKTLKDLIDAVAREISMPVCFAGGIRDMRDVDFLMRRGIEKISICTSAIMDPSLISQIANKFGSQAISVCIDYKILNASKQKICFGSGEFTHDVDPLAWAYQCQENGAGEIILNCISMDGSKLGFNFTFSNEIRGILKIPIILSGGCGSWTHFKEGLLEMDMDGLAASTFFTETDQNIVELKQKLSLSGAQVRID